MRPYIEAGDVAGGPAYYHSVAARILRAHGYNRVLGFQTMGLHGRELWREIAREFREILGLPIRKEEGRVPKLIRRARDWVRRRIQGRTDERGRD